MWRESRIRTSSFRVLGFGSSSCGFGGSCLAGLDSEDFFRGSSGLSWEGFVVVLIVRPK